ncbi:MAG: hypothetical protein ACLFV3_11530 [Phycisphaeraceae bacterium]
MPGPADVAADINEYLSGAPISSDRLKSLAEAYAAWCRRAVSRLDLCVDHVRRGQRSEALRLAEEPPRLLELVASLELQYPEQWQALCKARQFPVPEPPSEQAAAELNEAYAAENQLEHHLRWLRLQVLSGVPLAQRLWTLRKLVSLEPDHPGWCDDLLAHERARQEEILNASVTVSRADDVRALRNLVEELTQTRWVAPPAPDLVSHVRQRLRQVEATRAEQRLAELGPALEDAYAAMDYDEASRLLAEWDRLVEDNALEVDAERRERLAPLRQWLAGERASRQRRQQFGQACFRLARDIDGQVPLKTLEESHRAAEQFGIALPVDLESRYRAEVARHLRQRRRKRGVLLGTGSLVLAGMVWGTVTLVHGAIHNAHVQEQHTALAGLIDAGQAAEARDFWQRMMDREPELADEPEMLREKRRLDSLLEAEKQRRGAWQEQFARAEGLLTDPKLEAEVADPQVAGDAAVTARLEQVEQAIADARSSARVGSERARMAELESQLAALRRTRQGAVDQRFSQRLSEAVQHVGRLTTEMLENDPARFAGHHETARREVANLRMMTRVSPELRGDLDPLEHRLEQLARQLADHRRWLAEQRDLEQLGQSAATVDSYVRALRGFTREYPDSPKTIAFTQALEQQDHWRALPAWEKLWQEHGPREPFAGETEPRQQAIAVYLKNHPQSPFAETLRTLQMVERQAAQVVANEGPWKKSLRDLLGSGLLSRIDQVVIETNRRELVYYVPSRLNLQETGGRVFFQAILTPDRTSRDLRYCRDEQLVERRPAPQMLLSEQITARLRHLEASDWNTIGLEVARMIRDHEELDPILKAVLLGEVFSLMARHGAGYEQEATRIAEAIRYLEANDLEWMNPEQPDLERARARIAEALGEIVSDSRLAAMETAASRQAAALADALEVRYRGLGALVRGPDRQWRVLAPTKRLPGAAGLYHLRPTAEGETDELVPLGEIRGGQIQLDAARLPGAAEGTPVFVMEGQLP